MVECGPKLAELGPILVASGACCFNTTDSGRSRRAKSGRNWVNVGQTLVVFGHFRPNLVDPEPNLAEFCRIRDNFVGPKLIEIGPCLSIPGRSCSISHQIWSREAQAGAGGHGRAPCTASGCVTRPPGSHTEAKKRPRHKLGQSASRASSSAPQKQGQKRQAWSRSEP